MKRILLFLAMCVLVLPLAGCNLFGKNTGVEGQGSGEQDKYTRLNEMLGEEYKSVTLTVNDTFDEELTLVSVYTVNYGESITVDYEVQRLASVSLDNPSNRLKVTFKGTATIVDGVVYGGEDIGLDANITGKGLTFKAEYFENATLNDMLLQADVKNASGFFGRELNCTDMKVSASFLTKFFDIEISYTAQNGNKVEYTYVFGY